MPAYAQPITQQAALTTTLATVGTAVPTGFQRRVSINVANISATTTDTTRADVAINDGTNTRYLARNVTVGYGTLFSLDDVLLDAGWRVQGQASANSALDMVITGLETAK